MALISLDRIKEIMDVPAAAETLLNKPEKEIRFSVNLRVSKGNIISYDAFVVYHNIVIGPPKGGIRFSPNVTLQETRNLAEIMTYKNALMGLPFGGGKSGIRFDPYKVEDFTRVAIIKEYVYMMRRELLSGSYIPAPDMGSTPEDMATIYGETDRPETVTGKPVIIGGLPGRLQATGRGVAYAAKLGTENILGKRLSETSVILQGFGNVGRWSAEFLKQMGARIIAVADIGGVVYNKKGLDIEKLVEHCPASRNSVAGFPDSESISFEEFLSLESDIFIPAAVENVITSETTPLINSRLIIEGANDPTSEEAEECLLSKGIKLLPDFFANSGGVIASYIEWRNAKSGNQTSEAEVFDVIDKKIESCFMEGVRVKREKGCKSFRDAFSVLALHALIEGMKARLWI